MGKHQPRVANEDAANNKRLAVIHKMEPQGIDYTLGALCPLRARARCFPSTIEGMGKKRCVRRHSEEANQNQKEF